MTAVHGTARVVAAGERDLTWRLPRAQPTAVGRAPHCGIRLMGGRIPRLLAVLTPQHFGWLLENGSSSRVTLTGPGVRGARFEPHAYVALTRGEWVVDWALDAPLQVQIRVQAGAAPTSLPWARDRPVVAPLWELATTNYVADEVPMSPAERHLLAVLFAHEFSGTPAPRNLCGAAAARLTLPVSAVKNRANTIRRRINSQRPSPIDTFEELGFYLVHTARTLSPDDLTP